MPLIGLSVPVSLLLLRGATEFQDCLLLGCWPPKGFLAYHGTIFAMLMIFNLFFFLILAADCCLVVIDVVRAFAFGFLSVNFFCQMRDSIFFSFMYSKYFCWYFSFFSKPLVLISF